VDKRALIVANSGYDDVHFEPLPAATADAEQLVAVLADPEIGGFTVDTVVDRDQRTVMRALESCFAPAHPHHQLRGHI
jgi:molecular chaperone DnaK